MAYEKNYGKRLIGGLTYQDKVTKAISDHMDISLTTFCSPLYQEKEGENAQGWEIKKVSQVKKKFRIEVGSRPTIKHDWKDSGVNKKDNSYMYIMGDDDDIYFFWKKMLIKLVNDEKKKQEFNEKYQSFLEYKETATGKFYLVAKQLLKDLWGLRLDLKTGELSMKDRSCFSSKTKEA